MIAEWLYDKNGEAKIYLTEDRFLSKSDKEIGTLEGSDVFSMSGELIGSIANGVLYDTDNRAIAFFEHAKGYIPSLTDITGNTQMDEAQNIPANLGDSGEPVVPVHGDWSDMTLEELFGTEL